MAGIRVMFSNKTACDSTYKQKINENSVIKEKQNSVAELDAKCSNFMTIRRTRL